MPLGMLIMHWDERIGVEIMGAYPEEATIPEKSLMQLYSQHEFTGEVGMVSIMTGPSNLASYYTGAETGIYIILMLNIDEDSDAYEEGLAEISGQILKNLEVNSLKMVLPSIFQRLSVYPTLNEEQRISMIPNSEIKRMVLKRLQEEVAITKSEIAIWLKDRNRYIPVDIENIVASLIKANLVKIVSVKGLSSDVIFLVRDVMMIRRPPMELFRDPVGHHIPESLADAYKEGVINFFKNYKVSEQDNLDIIDKIILSPSNYEVLKLLREAIVTRNDIEKLKKKGVDDVSGALKDLWETKMIGIFTDEHGTEYYGLVSDFYVDFYFPRHLLNTIRDQYKLKAQNSKALLKALDLLKEEFFAMEHAKKLKSKTLA